MGLEIQSILMMLGNPELLILTKNSTQPHYKILQRLQHLFRWVSLFTILKFLPERLRTSYMVAGWY